MKRLQLFVVLACVVLIGTLSYAGVVKKGQNATVEQTVTVDKSIDLTTGSITTTFNPDYFPGQGPIVTQFTALSALASADLLNGLVSQTGCDPQLQSQLAALAGSCGNPTTEEFLSACSSPSELVYNTTDTTTSTQEVLVGYQTVDEGGCGCSYSIPVYQCESFTTTTQSGNIVQNPTSADIFDAGSIKSATVGGRVASESTSICPIGTYTVANLAAGSSTSTSTDSIGCFDFATTTTTTNVQANVTVNAYQVTGSVYVSPIVLDLTGTGKLEASKGKWLPHPGKIDNKNVQMFDLYANGFPMIMEWVGPHDGLLVEPKADGSVDGTCLFGVQGGWDNGYEKLLVRDTNGDTRLSGDELNGLAVWVDANRNGVADAGEVKTLQELGITEINLNHKAYKSTFVMNGKTHTMWDWWPTGLSVKKMKVADLEQISNAANAK